jgi:hypothetical protein
MALKMTNCLLEHARKQKIPCSDREDIDTCTSQLRGDSWTSYSNFYTHIDNLCYYYRSLIWEEKTEKLVTGLSQSAESTRAMLDQNLESTREILKSQSALKEDLQKSVELQEMLREGLHQNSRLFETMTANMSTSLGHFHNELMTHYKSIYTIFKGVDTALTHISNMQSFILNEVVYSYGSIIFFSVALAVGFILCSIEIFEGAKFPVLVIIVANAGIEFIIKTIGLTLFSTVKIRLVCFMLIAFMLYFSYNQSENAKK